MRIVQTNPSLPNYYDRQAQNVTLNVLANSLAPHTSTLRASYTVPDGKKAFVDNVFMLVTRGSLATAVGRARLTLYYTPANGAQIPLAICQLMNNAYEHAAIEQLQHLGVFFSGDKLEVYTSDGGTGGTCHYWCTLKIFEFV